MSVCMSMSVPYLRELMKGAHAPNCTHAHKYKCIRTRAHGHALAQVRAASSVVRGRILDALRKVRDSTGPEVTSSQVRGSRGLVLRSHATMHAHHLSTPID